MFQEKIYPKLITGILLLILIWVLGCTNITMRGTENSIDQTYLFNESRLSAFGLALQNFPENERDSVVIDFIQENSTTPIIESDTVASFYWYGKAGKVLMYCDLFDGWSKQVLLQVVSCGDSSFFYGSFILPTDARVDYQFQIDSIFTTDKRNPIITPSGYGKHSQIAMPGFQPDPVRNIRQDVPNGTFDSIALKSQHSSITERKAKIYLPNGYENLNNLPVIYVMDGIEAIEFMSYSVVLDNLIADRKIEPVIAVFIPPGDRHNEFMGEISKAFIATLCDEWVKVIDSAYKTNPVPEKRGITGLSSGGHFALHTVLKRPDVFLCGAGQSSTITDSMFNALRAFLSEGKNSPSLRFYFDVGRYDLALGPYMFMSFMEANESFSHELKSSGVTHRFSVYNDGHQWANWRERTDEILTYFFGIED